MRDLTYKEYLIVISALLTVGLSVIVLGYSSKDWSDIAANALSDLLAVLVTALIVTRILAADRKSNNKGKRRALAREVQKIYQHTDSVITTLIEDGVQNNAITNAPTAAQISSIWTKYNKPGVFQGSLNSDVEQFAAYYLLYYNGNKKARVVDYAGNFLIARNYIGPMAREIDSLYGKVIASDFGFLTDEIIDAIVKIRQSGLIVFATITDQVPNTIGFWADADIQELINAQTTLSRFFEQILEYRPGSYAGVLAQKIEGAIQINKQVSWPI